MNEENIKNIPPEIEEYLKNNNWLFSGLLKRISDLEKGQEEQVRRLKYAESLLNCLPKELCDDLSKMLSKENILVNNVKWVMTNNDSGEREQKQRFNPKVSSEPEPDKAPQREEPKILAVHETVLMTEDGRRLCDLCISPMRGKIHSIRITLCNRGCAYQADQAIKHAFITLKNGQK
jgi:hypothetical protein